MIFSLYDSRIGGVVANARAVQWCALYTYTQMLMEVVVWVPEQMTWEKGGETFSWPVHNHQLATLR
jgi:hypothetical protein